MMRLNRLFVFGALLFATGYARAQIVYYGATGQSLYARFDDGSNTAVNLTEGSTLNLGRYVASNAAIVSASLASSTTPYTYRILIGTAGGQSSGDIAIGTGATYWNGTVTQDSLTAHGYTSTRAAALDSVGSSLTDINSEAVAASRTWMLLKDTLVGDGTRNLTVGDHPTFCLDFANDMASNDYISVVGTPSIVTGTAGGITFGSPGRDHSKAKVRITGVTAGTYVFKVLVTYVSGATRTGTVTLKVN